MPYSGYNATANTFIEWADGLPHRWASSYILQAMACGLVFLTQMGLADAKTPHAEPGVSLRDSSMDGPGTKSYYFR
jgi:hypothetical protein